MPHTPHWRACAANLSPFNRGVVYSNNRVARRKAGIRRPATHTYAAERIAAYGERQAPRQGLRRLRRIVADAETRLEAQAEAQVEANARR